MSSIVIVSGGRTPGAAGVAADRLRALGHAVRTIRAGELPVGALLSAERAEPAIADAVAAIASADAVVLSTPVRRASCSGLVKSLLELLPPGALHGKAVLPLVTGALAGHARIVELVLVPLLRSLGAAPISRAVFVPQRRLGSAGAAIGVLRAVEEFARQVDLPAAA
jgi:FMN reductase